MKNLTKNISLKKKQNGRNRDYLVSEMDNYIEMKKGIEKHQKDLEVSNNKLIELDNNSNKVKEIVDNLKPTLSNKKNML